MGNPSLRLFEVLYVGWGKDWGERKVIMYKGTPAKCFFQCVDLVAILMQIV